MWFSHERHDTKAALACQAKSSYLFVVAASSAWVRFLREARRSLSSDTLFLAMSVASVDPSWLRRDCAGADVAHGLDPARRLYLWRVSMINVLPSQFDEGCRELAVMVFR